MAYVIINYILQCNEEVCPIVRTARVITDIQVPHAKHAAHSRGRKTQSTEMALGINGDNYPTPCLYVNHLYCYQFLMLSLLKSL